MALSLTVPVPSGPKTPDRRDPGKKPSGITAKLAGVPLPASHDAVLV